MNTRHALIVIAVVAGVASGPSLLDSAALSQPPLSWSDLAFVFAGCALGLPLVLSFQAMVGNGKALRWGWSFFALGAIYAAAAGATGSAMSAVRAEIGPHSFLFLAVGCGLAVGAAVVRRLLGRQLHNVA